MADFLAAMAVMKVNYDRRGHDVLQMLVPFVADCARTYNQPLSDDSIQRDLNEKFGLPVPRTVVKTLLRRLARAGALVREHGVFVPVRGEIDKPEYDLSAGLADVQRNQAALLQQGVAFASRVFGISLSTGDLSTALLTLARREVAPLATWAIQGRPVAIETELDEGLAQIAAQYILHVTAEGSGSAQAALEQIAKGSLLSGVLWSTDTEAPDRRIDGLELFLDTTLLLRLLGLCGPTRQAFSGELVALARESGISLYCFEHTRAEIVGVLSAAEAVLRSARSVYYGEAVEYVVSEGWSASDVEEVIASLDDRLAECGVEVRRKPPREARYNMDEVRLRELLDKRVHYSNRVALDADVDSLASIFILRRARHSERLESSHAAFVTTNTNLALGSRQLYQIGEDQMRGVPLALIETQVASYLWARRPGMADALPLNLLAMGALSIAEAEPRRWLQYVAKLDELRSREKLPERNYVLLRQSLLARSILLTTTDGDPDALSEDTADYVMKHALAEHTRELQQEIRQREEALVTGAEQLRASEAKAAEAEAARHDREREQMAAFTRVARKNARRVVVIAGFTLAVLVLVASVISFPWPIEPPLSTVLPAWLSIALGVVAIAIGTASVVVGSTIHGVGEKLIDGLTEVLARRYKSRFAPNEDVAKSPIDPV